LLKNRIGHAAHAELDAGIQAVTGVKMPFHTKTCEIPPFEIVLFLLRRYFLSP
jgi:hypothetical protein